MRSFQSLTSRGQVRRLRHLALNALSQYDLKLRRIRLLAADTNTLFRIDTMDGERFVLRVCVPGWRTEDDLRREIAWLLDLAKYPNLGTPVPILSHHATYFVYASALGVDNPRRCLLTTWVPGVSMKKYLDELHLEHMGELFAQLHLHAAEFLPPPEPNPRQMIHYLARDEPYCLFDPGQADAFTSHSRHIFDQVQDRVLAAFRNLYADPAGLRIIHNDLWHGNVNVYHSHLYPLDFEDTLWGYPVQDIAMALQDLMDDTSLDQFEILQAAFIRGYTRISVWPETYSGQVDDFRAGRMLWVANYIACFQRPYLAHHISDLATIFEQYLKTGLLRKLPNPAGV